jgi:hypothetical protein
MISWKYGLSEASHFKPARLPSGAIMNASPTSARKTSVAWLGYFFASSQNFSVEISGQAVDEDTDYKRRRDDWTELIPEAAETHLSGLTKKLNCRTDASTLCGAESAN